VQFARYAEAYLANDVCALRMTWRLGWGVMLPAGVVKLSLA
jgi:hypothetical protein